MSICYLSLSAIFLGIILIYIFRKPSKDEIKKFESKDQDKINWSKMGF